MATETGIIRMDWVAALGRDRSATDQEPGYYRYRARRGAPWQPVRIILDGDGWHCLVRGEPVAESGRRDPLDIPFIRDRGPFHSISLVEYRAMIEDYRTAAPGSPLLTPDDPVDLRGSAPL